MHAECRVGYMVAAEGTKGTLRGRWPAADLQHPARGEPVSEGALHTQGISLLLVTPVLLF
jgi:hypothetical protein